MKRLPKTAKQLYWRKSHREQAVCWPHLGLHTAPVVLCLLQTQENESGCLEQLLREAEITYIRSNQQANVHHLEGVAAESCSMVIHHTNYCSWLLIHMGTSYTANNDQEWISSYQSALHILTLSGTNSSCRQPHAFENAIRGQLWLLWSCDEVPCACRWECRRFQGTNRQKKLFLLANLSEEYFTLGSWAKYQETRATWTRA